MNLIELICWTLVLWVLCLAAIYLARWTGIPVWVMSFFVVSGTVIGVSAVHAAWRRGKHGAADPPVR